MRYLCFSAPRRSTLSGLLLVWPLVFLEPAPLWGQPFEPPLLIVSAGQSPDIQLAAVLARRAGIEHTLNPTATARDLVGARTLALVIGASLKGLGAAGVDLDKEKGRIQTLLAEAQRKQIPVLVLHLGGEQRRGELTDELITAFLPGARWALILESSDRDGLFTRICREKGIPLHRVGRTADGAEVLKAAFRSGN